MALRAHHQIEPAGILCGGRDGAVQIEFLGRTFAGEAAQTAQRDLDVARAQLDGIVQVAVLTLFPHLDRSAVARRFATDTDAFRVVAVVAER